MPRFSVVLIAKNEGATLPRLVDSLTEFQKRGGEIVLLDTGSTDGTPQIARDRGCVVHEVGDKFVRLISHAEADLINRGFVADAEHGIVSVGDRLFDYSAARNYAANLASNNMIAMPDCDEIYTKIDIDKINEAIDSGIEQLEYNFVFAHDAAGREVIKFLHSKFYDRRKAHWTGIIHEVLAGDVKRQAFPEDVIKLEHWQNPETNRAGYLKGLALDVLLNPSNDRNAHYFARELMYADRPRSALAQFERHIRMSAWAPERSQSMVHMGEIYMKLGDAQRAVHMWIDAFDICPDRREPLMKIAEYYLRAGSPKHAISYVFAALRIPQSNFYAAFQPYYEHAPHEILYQAYEKMGDEMSARAELEKCLGMQPFHPFYLKEYNRLFKVPKISIVIPTLRDKAALDRTISSIQQLNYPKDQIETIILRDEPRIGVPKRVKEGVEKSTGEYIVYAADDMEFEPDAIAAALQAMRMHGKQFCAFSSGPVYPDEGNICEHFIIGRSLVNQIGEVFDTEFRHVGVDNLLWAKMKKLGHAMRSEHARVTHHHFSKTGEMDDVHRLAWDPADVEHDRALLEKKLAEL